MTDYARFVSMFEEHERPYVEILLKKMVVLDKPRIMRALQNAILDRGLHVKCCFIGLGRVTESGNMMLTDLRRQWSSKIARDQCFLSSDIFKIDFTKFRRIIFIDDFIGTGQQAATYFSELPKPFPKPIFYYHLAGLEDGINHVKRELSSVFPNFSVVTLFPGLAKPAFGFGVLEKDEEIVREICVRYGEMLRPYERTKHQKLYPLGFRGSACLFTSIYNTPNNTLPIFWSTVEVPGIGRWPAPFPRSHKEETTDAELLEHDMHEDHRIGQLVVDKIAKHQRFDPPLTDTQITNRLSEPKPLPPVLEAYFRRNVDARIDHLRAQGKTVTINNGYSLHAVKIDKEQTGDRLGRSHRPDLVFEPADYSHQIMFGERINEERLVDDEGQLISIREFMYRHSEVDFAHFEWGDVQRIPIPQRFANVIGLVVRKNLKKPEQGKCLICGVRSKAMAVSEAGESKEYWPVTMSCAEGMLRPDDAAGEEKIAPSPFNTASRALNEELGLQLGVHFELSDLRLLSLSYDSNRCQPVAVFFLELENIEHEGHGQQ